MRLDDADLAALVSLVNGGHLALTGD
jgi:hypothetical protein